VTLTKEADAYVLRIVGSKWREILDLAMANEQKRRGRPRLDAARVASE
jgi:hypothetical protein